MFRRVTLPAHVRGTLLLYRMPGHREPLEQVWEQARADGVQVIVNLARPEELQEKSPAYAKALEAGPLPCPVISFPVRNHRTPLGREAFWELARALARRLEAGDRVLIHCFAGKGRTGTLAACVLIALGEAQAAAIEAVQAAGSSPETGGQAGIVAWCVQRRQDNDSPIGPA